MSFQMRVNIHWSKLCALHEKVGWLDSSHATEAPGPAGGEIHPEVNHERSNLPMSIMRFLIKMFPLFFLGFLVAAPCVRAQFQSGCCNQFGEQTLRCSNTNPTCSSSTSQFFCRVYAGEGVTGITAVAGGVVCCNKI